MGEGSRLIRRRTCSMLCTKLCRLRRAAGFRQLLWQVLREVGGLSGSFGERVALYQNCRQREHGSTLITPARSAMLFLAFLSSRRVRIDLRRSAQRCTGMFARPQMPPVWMAV